MPITKISDIKNAVTPNQYDAGSSRIGLSASYAKAVLTGQENVEYWTPEDSDDLSRCVVVIEQFKSQTNLTDEEKIAGLNKLRATSYAWEGILSAYDELKDALIKNIDPDVITRKLQGAINSVIQREITLDHFKQVKSKLKEKADSYQFQTNDIHEINAYILEAWKRGYTGQFTAYLGDLKRPQAGRNRHLECAQVPRLLDPKEFDDKWQYSTSLVYDGLKNKPKDVFLQKRIPRSNEQAFEQAKQSFAQGDRTRNLAQQLERYSLWKAHKSSTARSSHLQQAKNMLGEISALTKARR